MWTKIKDFLMSNKVFILGLISALAVVLQQALVEPSINWPTMAFGAGIAVLSYIANQWRGQGVTLFGIIGTVAYVISTTIAYGVPIEWGKLLIAIILAILSAFMPPAKSVNYEKSAVIEKAKEQATVITEDKKAEANK